MEPEHFVAARSALAKRIRAAGDRAEAARVAKLRRPSAGAWALNHVSRGEPALVAAALEAGAAVRAATEGTGGDLRTAAAAEREATDAVVQAASVLLGPRADAHRLDLSATIRAAAHDDDLAASIRTGTLDELRGSSGFGFDADGPVPPPFPKPREVAPQPPAAPTPDPRAAERDRLEAERAARRRRAELAIEADRLAKRAARLAHEADTAATAARAARAAADEAAVAAASAAAELERS